MIPDIPMMFHPSLGVTDLALPREWFPRVFGREVIEWRSPLSVANSDFRTSYSVFVNIADLHMQAHDPALRTGNGAIERFATKRFSGVGLNACVWYTTNAVALVERLADYGVRCQDFTGELVRSGYAPRSGLEADGFYMVFALPEDTGFHYSFVQYDYNGQYWKDHGAFYRAGDPRLSSDWVLPPVSPDDPLGIKKCHHHTIITTNTARALNLYVEALGGRIVATEYNRSLDADSTYLEFAGSILEFASPRLNTSPLLKHVAEGRDHYYGITFQVSDSERTERHLRDVGISPKRDFDGGVTIDPGHGLGAWWRFVEIA